VGPSGLYIASVGGDTFAAGARVAAGTWQGKYAKRASPPPRPMADRSARSPRRSGFGSGGAASGETLLQSLARRGFPNVVRSVRYHRPRGPFCGLGHCTGCLVRLNGRPNVRACRHLVEAGDRVRTENAWPGPRFDLFGALDLLFPRGLDTLHGFRRPAWATRAYQRVVRRLAGYGAVPDPIADGVPGLAPRCEETDVAIVGAGGSGRAAAKALAGQGLRPLVVDRSLEAEDVAGANVVRRATVTFLPPPRTDGPRPFVLLGFEESGRGVSIRARAVVLATGGYDASLVFEGSDRPGVIAADLAFRLAPNGGRLPFDRAMVFGGGSRAREVLDRLGRSVTAVASPGEIGPEVVRRASELGIPLYPRSLLIRTRGRSRVRSAELRTRGRGARFSIACDAIVLAHRRLPNSPLLFQAGARMSWRSPPGAYFPETGPDGATSVPGLFVAGTAGGFPADDRRASGERAGRGAATREPGRRPEARTPPASPSELDGYYRELLAERRKGKWVVCPCEDILLEEVETANRAGFRSIEVVKRYTGLGTGLCQGRYCLPDALLLLAHLEGRPPAEVGYITQRPPLVPTPLPALAALADEFLEEAVA
jgi:sarcosine oxidase, subunit alpha